MKWLNYALVIAALTLSACDQPAPPSPPEATAQKVSSAPSLNEQASFVSYLGLTAYTDMSQATQAAQELDNKLAKFLYEPTDATLENARNAWRNAYDLYLQTLIYSRLPLKDPDDWLQKGIGYQQTIAMIDTWPIEPGYIDYVPGYPFSGIVNDLALPLTEANLRTQHRFSDSSSASLGFHAIEFMLWHVDGKRTIRDFFSQENTAPLLNDSNEENLGEASEFKVQNHHRRRQYLQLTSDQLQKHLHRLQRRFEPSNGYYAKLLEQSPPTNVMRASLVATQKLIAEELLGKRLTGNSSEFSQTSWVDALAISEGIRHVFLPNDEQQGLAMLIGDSNAELIDQWRKQLEEMQANMRKLQSHSSEATQQATRQSLIEFLSLLGRTAKVLDVSLPNVNTN